jgi:HK97 family phage major capsid protein
MTSIRENLQRVYDERANLWETQGKPLADIANERALSAEEQGKFEQVERDFGAFGSRIKLLELGIEQERAIADFSAQLESDPALRTAFESELRAVFSQRTKVGIDLTFTGKEMSRALAKGAAGTGGAAVPTTTWDQLILPLRNFVSVLSAGATQITTASGEALVLPRISSYGSASQYAEAAAISGTDPSTDSVTLSAYKLGEVILTSRELVEDAAVDIEGLITNLIGQNIGILLGQRLATGTGASQTTGIVTAATVGVTGGTAVAGAFTFDNLIDLFYSVPAPYRANGSWIFADTALGALRKLKDTTNQYLWQPSTQLGQPDLLSGRPVFGEPNMAAPGLNALPVLFGDVSKYWVRFVNTLRIERSDQAAFTNDQIAFRGVLRADGVLTDASAVKTFKGGAS